MTDLALAHRRPYLVLLLVSFGVFVAADDLTVVSTLLPQMIAHFRIPLPSGLDDASWIVSAYLIAYIVTMPFMGRVSDIYGRLKVYLACLGLFVLGSLAIPFVPTLPWLIVFRAVQALGGGAMVPVAMAIVGDLFQDGRRPLAMGILVAVDTAGWIFGPLYGAFLVRFLSWQWQFYINIPAGLLAALSAYFVLRDMPQQRRAARPDIPGALLLLAGLVALNVALSFSGGQAATGVSFDFDRPAPQSRLVLPLLGAAALLLGLFVLVEWRRPQPLVDLRMFRRPNFAVACAINFFLGAALIIAMVDVPVFVNSVLARGSTLDEMVRSVALYSGGMLAALTAAMAAASPPAGWLCARLGYRWPALLGLLCAAGGLGLMGTWSPESRYIPMALHLALAGLGFGLATAPLSTAVIDAVDETQRGVASGLVLILRLIGMSVGLSLLTAWGLQRFDALSAPYSITGLSEEIFLHLTAQVLSETFLVASGVLLATSTLAFLLRRRPVPQQEKVYHQGG